jgi:hypothetical protein
VQIALRKQKVKEEENRLKITESKAMMKEEEIIKNKQRLKLEVKRRIKI